jgi:hypothetical protein
MSSRRRIPPEYVETRRSAASGGAPAQVPQPAHQEQVLATRQRLVHGGVLASEADQAPDRLGLATDVVPGHERAAAVRQQQRGEDADRRGLTGAVRAEQREHGASAHPQVEASQDRHRAERLGHALTFDCV